MQETKINFYYPTSTYSKSDYLLQFDGLQDVIKSCHKLANYKKWQNSVIRFYTTQQNFWSFSDRFCQMKKNECEDIKHVVNNLNLDIDNIINIADKELTDFENNNNDFGFDVCGLNYDTGLYLSGQPEYWITPIETAQKPLIKIYIDNCTSYDRTNREIRDRALKQLAIALYFIKNQFPVEFHCVCGMYRKKYTFIDINLGLYTNTNLIDFLYLFASHITLRYWLVAYIMRYYFNSAKTACVVSGYSVQRYLKNTKQNDNDNSCSVYLTNDIEAYTDKAKVFKFLSDNPFEANNFYAYT